MFGEGLSHMGLHRSCLIRLQCLRPSGLVRIGDLSDSSRFCLMGGNITASGYFCVAVMLIVSYLQEIFNLA